MATIRDVAAAAGVSIATVSRVIHEEPRVSEATRRKVILAAEKLDYALQPRPARPRLDDGYLLVVTSRIGYWDAIFEGISEQARIMQYAPIIRFIPHLTEVDPIGSVLQEYTEHELPIAGIILNGSASEQSYRGLLSNYPTVICGQYYDLPGAFSVSCDNFRSAADLARKMFEEGCKRPMILTKGERDPLNRQTQQQQRAEGFRYACAQAGFGEVTCIEDTEQTDEQVLRTVDWMMAQPEPPDLLLFTRGEEAVRFRMAFAARGIPIPERLRLAAFDIDLLPAGSLTGIDYVQQDFHQFGVESVRMIDSMIHGGLQSGRKLFVDYRVCSVRAPRD